MQGHLNQNSLTGEGKIHIVKNYISMKNNPGLKLLKKLDNPKTALKYFLIS